MKIPDIHQDGNMIQYIQQNGKHPGVEKNQPPQTVNPEVKVDLSAESKEMKKIHDVLAATPEVRTERVEALKKLVESGQYDVKSEAIADKMVNEFLWDMNQ